MKHDNASHSPGIELDEARLAAVSGGARPLSLSPDPDPDPW